MRRPSKTIRDYVVQALRGFELDPADSDLQRGYEDALRELARVYGFTAETKSSGISDTDTSSAKAALVRANFNAQDSAIIADGIMDCLDLFSPDDCSVSIGAIRAAVEYNLVAGGGSCKNLIDSLQLRADSRIGQSLDLHDNEP